MPIKRISEWNLKNNSMYTKRYTLNIKFLVLCLAYGVLKRELVVEAVINMIVNVITSFQGTRMKALQKMYKRGHG